MLRLYELEALDRSAEFLRYAENYRRRAGALDAPRETRISIGRARCGAGHVLVGLGKRLAGNV